MYVLVFECVGAPHCVCVCVCVCMSNDRFSVPYLKSNLRPLLFYMQLEKITVSQRQAMSSPFFRAHPQLSIISYSSQMTVSKVEMNRSLLA